MANRSSQKAEVERTLLSAALDVGVGVGADVGVGAGADVGSPSGPTSAMTATTTKTNVKSRDRSVRSTHTLAKSGSPGKVTAS